MKARSCRRFAIAIVIATRCNKIINGPKKTGTRFIGNRRKPEGDVNIPAELEITSHENPKTCHNRKLRRGLPEGPTSSSAAGIALNPTTMSLIPVGKLECGRQYPL